MQSDEHLPVNIGNPHEITLLEFANKIKKLTSTSIPIVLEPLPENDPKHRRPDITKAKKLLGWEPKVELREGLEKTLAYFQEVPASSKTAIR